MDGGVTSTFLQQGILGAIVVVLAGVVFYQNKKIEKLYDRLYQSEQERRTDAVEARDKITEPLEGLALGMKMLSDKLSSSKRSR